MEGIFIIMLIGIIIALCLLLKFVMVKRRVIVTIVKNLPIGIFRDKNKSYETENKVYVKEIIKDASDQSTILESQEKEDGDCTNNGQVNDDEVINGKDTEAGENSNREKNNIVYWTPKGKTYHMSKSCFALSRSKIINHGTIEESEKSTICDLCKDNL